MEINGIGMEGIKSPVNSRLRRKVARAVTLGLEQDSRKWKEGYWLQWQKGGGGQSKMWTSGASGSQDHGLFTSVMGFGTTRIGENSSCNISQAPSIVSQIRWYVKALKKCRCPQI